MIKVRRTIHEQSKISLRKLKKVPERKQRTEEYSNWTKKKKYMGSTMEKTKHKKGSALPLNRAVEFIWSEQQNKEVMTLKEYRGQFQVK